MKLPGRFITIHGIDGTGKSTLVDELVARLDNSAINFRNLEMPTFETSGASDPRQRLLQSLGKKAQEDLVVREQTSRGLTVVKDRWIIDVLADNLFRGACLDGVETEDLPQPDLAVLLHCEESTRMRRILERPDATEDDLIPVEPGTRAAYFQDYLFENLGIYAPAQLVLDTTDQRPEQLSRQVIVAAGLAS